MESSHGQCKIAIGKTMLKLHEHFWLPKLKKCVYTNHGTHISSNYTQADVALHGKYIQRKIFWKKLIGDKLYKIVFAKSEQMLVDQLINNYRN
jgi:hypothetical protein